MESALLWHPSDDCEVGRRRGPKARDGDSNRPIRVHVVDAHSLELKSNNSAVIQVPHSELHGSQVRKRAEQIEMLSLGELADHLRLTQKTQRATLQPTSLFGNRHGWQAERHAKFLYKSIRGHQPLQPTAIRSGSHAERHPVFRHAPISCQQTAL